MISETRQRLLDDPDMVEVAPGRFRNKKFMSHPRKSRSGILIMEDIEPFVSPVDGSVVSSRAARREHNARNDVEDIGNDPAFRHPSNGGCASDMDPGPLIREIMA